MSDPQDAVLTGIVQIVAETSHTLERVGNTLEAQNAAILAGNALLQETPTRRYVNAGIAVLTLVITAVLVFSTVIVFRVQRDTQEAQRATQQISAQNQFIVDSYCQAQPESAECKLPGSPTTKATAILTNCNLFAIAQASTPPERRSSTPIVNAAACQSLGF